MWTTLIVFCIILFTYIHIQDQIKTGEDLEIYEYEYVSLKGLHEITQYKQPVLFALAFEMPIIDQLDPISIKDIRDYYKSNTTCVESIYLSQQSAKRLLDTDSKSLFYSNRNQSSIAKSEAWTKWFESIDPFLNPAFTIHKDYDILYGSHKTHTITTYHRESHTYIYLPPETNTTHIRVKMTPWKSRTFMDEEADYTYYEFWTKTNLFDKHDRLRCLDFSVQPGYVLYIPPYWFYSIEFQNKSNEVCMVKYTTGANILANVKHIGKYYLQQQNIQEKWWKPIENQYEPEIQTTDLSQNVISETELKKTTAEKLVSELQPTINTDNIYDKEDEIAEKYIRP